jgi:D-alanyl-lipoteichoic acid acyltransferase DltB (MBOAT superfamily)
VIRARVRAIHEIPSHRCQVTRRSPVRLDTMLFPTFQFAVFFAVVFAIAWSLARRTTAWKLFLLAASYGFYASWNWRFLPLLVGLPLANQACAVVIARRPRLARIALTTAVALDLGTLVALKYLGFLSAACTTALHLAGLHIALPMVQWVLPLGVSFITFQALSYVVDVYRGTMKPASTLDVAMYVAFFPHVVAGPIVRAAEFVPQVGASPDASRIGLATSVLQRLLPACATAMP